MLGVVLVLVFAAGLYAAARKLSAGGSSAVALLVIAGYGSRLVLSLFIREIQFFSHAAGGDCNFYDDSAALVARLWSYEGIHWVRESELPALGRTTLPANLFALIKYVDGGEAQLGCNALIAFLACVACLNIYALALEAGASQRAATTVLATLLFLPSFLYYTSDMYKDGIVQFCVVGIGGAALRLGRRFSLRHVVFALVCLAALSVTRFYLVYTAMIPLLLGLVGTRSRSPIRIIVSVTAISLGVLIVAGLTNASSVLVDDASGAYETVTSPEVHDAQERGGSSVEIEGPSITRFPIALAFTLFAPFVWQSGSIGLQLGKIDCLAWYVIAYFAVKGAIQMYRTRVSELLILLSFIVPTTFAYAAAFANIGLTVRERLGVVMMSALLAALGASPEAVAAKQVELSSAGTLRSSWVGSPMASKLSRPPGG